jgi:protein-disulfide isomerase
VSLLRNGVTQIHPHALHAAQAAEAAGQQGTFWEMHGMLLEDQRLEEIIAKALAAPA